MALLYPVTHDLSDRVIGAAITVHRQLGPGLLESAYRRCLQCELIARGVDARSEVPVSIAYKSERIEDAFRIDLLVEGRLVVELKAVDKLHPIHTSQVTTYLKLGGYHAGLLINFNVQVLKDGLKRVLL
jgi:GxxExxY protein